jgi:tripartite-type tricarboxylate transporter receptor subunit TctC
MFPSSFTRRALCVAALAGAACGALAQSRRPSGPAKPVTLVVPYSAGGGTDIVARALAQRLAELWGQQVVVDNRTGANGVVGSASVAKAAPDGHTLMMVVGSHAINPVLMKQLPYDTPRAFTPITRVADSPTVFVVAAGAPWKTLGDLVEAARKTEIPAGYSEGQTRLTGELANQAAGIKLSGVPYKGGAPIMVDVMGGHLPVGITSVLSALPHVRAGKLRVVGVADKQRTAVFPDALDLPRGRRQRRGVAQLVRPVRARRAANGHRGADQPRPEDRDRRTPAGQATGRSGRARGADAA